MPTPKHREGFALELLERDEHSFEDFAPKGSVYSLLWGRDTSAANTAAFLQSVGCDWLVTGHIPCDHGFATPNEQQIILDCCDAPAAYALLPANRPLNRNEVYATVRLV